MLRFDGQALLEAPRTVPPAGSLFVVFRTAKTASANQRLLGWEDSDVGKHGLSLMPEPGAGCGDPAEQRQVGGPRRCTPASEFEIVCVTWGPDGTTLHRNGTRSVRRGRSSGILGPGDQGPAPGRPRLREQPSVPWGSRGGPRLRRQLDEAGRKRVETELRAAWFNPADRSLRRATPWPICTTSCCRPRSLLVRRTSGRAMLPPRSGRGWPH